MANQTTIKQFWTLIPLFGTVLFAALYFIASLHYPGGSQFDKSAVGFSWVNNYWCNLLNDKAINGQLNKAQPIALTALLILCFSLTFFWLVFPKYILLTNYGKLTIQIFGMLAMTSGILLFTTLDHDFITNLASLFGLIAMIGTLSGLRKNGWKMLYYFGLFNLILVGVNNLLYYNKELILYLPLIQKITFATFLIWICCIDIKIYQLRKTTD